MNLLQKLSSRENFLAILDILKSKKKSKSWILQSAPIEKSISLAWCIYNQDLLIKYYLKNLRNHSYRPQVRIKMTIFIDKQRIIYNINWVDKIMDYALTKLLFDVSAEFFSDQLFSYRQGFSNKKAVKSLCKYIKNNQGSEIYIAKRDIKSYFDNINSGILTSQIKEKCGEQDSFFWKLLSSFLQPEYYDPELDLQEQLLLGIPTGSCISNFAANFYLHDLDHLAVNNLDFYVRYGDDIIFADRDKDKLNQLLNTYQEKILERDLKFHPDKDLFLKIGPTLASSKDSPYQSKKVFDYLGYQISDEGLIFLKSYKFKKLKKDIKSRLFNSYRTYYRAGLSKDLQMSNLIKDLNGTMRDLNYYNHFADLVLFTTDKPRLKEFDIWIAQTIIAMTHNCSRANAFGKISYRQIREAGLFSILNYKNIYPRRNEVLRSTKNLQSRSATT